MATDRGSAQRREVTADQADDKETVMIRAYEVRLPDVLRHIQAGKIVLVIPAPRPSPETK